MPLFELDRALSVIMSDMEFITKNASGNHMYSNALKHYRYYVHAVCEHSENAEYLDSIKNDSAIPETQRTAIIQSRVGQGVFRKLLMEKYSGSCIITGLDHPKLLVASHIKPWAVSTNAECPSVDNGLLLSATYDRLFNCGLITFKKRKIYLSPLISDQNIHRLHPSRDMRFDLRIGGNMGEYLTYHNDVLFLK